MICKHFVDTFLKEPGLGHTVIWFQVLLCNGNNRTSVIYLHTFELVCIKCKIFICQ